MQVPRRATGSDRVAHRRAHDGGAARSLRRQPSRRSETSGTTTEHSLCERPLQRVGRRRVGKTRPLARRIRWAAPPATVEGATLFSRMSRCSGPPYKCGEGGRSVGRGGRDENGQPFARRLTCRCRTTGARVECRVAEGRVSKDRPQDRLLRTAERRRLELVPAGTAALPGADLPATATERPVLSAVRRYGVAAGDVDVRGDPSVRDYDGADRELADAIAGELHGHCPSALLRMTAGVLRRREDGNGERSDGNVHCHGNSE